MYWIKAAFRKLALRFHPDHKSNSNGDKSGPTDERFRAILAAYEVLTKAG